MDVKELWKPNRLPNGQKDVLRITPTRIAPTVLTPGTVPTFAFPTDKEIQPQVVTASAVQIQYSQNMLLNFNGLSWPHVSVATVVPLVDVLVPAKSVK